jgi:hypothetical protein
LREAILRTLTFLDDEMQNSNNNADLIQMRTVFRNVIRNDMDQIVAELRMIAFHFFIMAEEFERTFALRIHPNNVQQELSAIQNILPHNVLKANRNNNFITAFQSQLDLVENRETIERRRITYKLVDKGKEILRIAEELLRINPELNMRNFGLGQVRPSNNTWINDLREHLTNQIRSTLQENKNVNMNGNDLANFDLNNRNNAAISERYQQTIEGTIPQKYCAQVLVKFYSKCFLLTEQLQNSITQYFN